MLHTKGQLYFAYLTCDSSVVIKVIQCEGPFLPVIFLYRYITLQFLRNMQRAADYLKQKACLQRRLSAEGGCLLACFLPPSLREAFRIGPGEASVHHDQRVLSQSHDNPNSLGLDFGKSARCFLHHCRKHKKVQENYSLKPLKYKRLPSKVRKRKTCLTQEDKIKETDSQNRQYITELGAVINTKWTYGTNLHQ